MSGGEAPAGPEAELAERVLRSADAAFERVRIGRADQQSMPPEPEPADVLRWVGDRVTELVADFAELPLDRLLGMAEPYRTGDDHDQSGASGGSAPAGEPLIATAPPGGVVEVRVWVHLVGQPPPATLRFRLTDLQDGDRTPLPGHEAIFEPAELDLATPVAASTLLRLPIPDDAVDGSYHGLVLGRGVDGAAVPLTVVIR